VRYRSAARWQLENSLTIPPSPLDRLIRSIAHDRYFEALEAHRACCEIGQPLVPEIVKRMRAANWRDLRPKEKLSYLTCLMVLLHDIDEAASGKLADEIIQRRKCHPAVVARLRSIQAFTLRDFEHLVHGQLSVYVALSISKRESVWEHLNRWLSRIPAEDLAGIRRVYVVEKDKLPEYWGLYLNVLSVVSLVWRTRHPLSWLAALDTEFTLYHEVGHHVDRRRSEPVESREAFADAYAEGLFRKAHPWLGRPWAQILVLPSFALRRMRRARDSTPISDSGGTREADRRLPL
jgi:hypothetical protein